MAARANRTPWRLREWSVSTSTFALTDVQRDFRATLRAFSEEKIAPNAAQADRTAEFPWKSFEACKEMELPALGMPAAYGGAGADTVTVAIMTEELRAPPRRRSPSSSPSSG